MITRVQEIISTISNIFEERHSEAKIWILCVDLQIFSAESLPRPPLTCSDHRPARMYNENLLKPYIQLFLLHPFVFKIVGQDLMKSTNMNWLITTFLRLGQKSGENGPS